MNRTDELRRKFEEVLSYDTKNSSQVKKGLFRVTVFLRFLSVFSLSW